MVHDLYDVLRACDAPLMVAHNGAQFDNIILRRMLRDATCVSGAHGIKWCDSQSVFGKGKLKELYDAMIGPCTQMRRAAADVQMMDTMFDHTGSLGS